MSVIRRSVKNYRVLVCKSDLSRHHYVHISLHLIITSWFYFLPKANIVEVVVSLILSMPAFFPLYWLSNQENDCKIDRFLENC